VEAERQLRIQAEQQAEAARQRLAEALRRAQPERKACGFCGGGGRAYIRQGNRNLSTMCRACSGTGWV
jgi:DnaJ-class molecular chaperone